MKKRHTLYFLFFLNLITLNVLYAKDLKKPIDEQEVVEDAKSDEYKDKMKQQALASIKQGDAVINQGPISSEVSKKRNEYLVFSLEHRKQVFSWQLQASKWIFVIVMLIVISGLVLSYMHFYKSLKNPASSSDTSNLDMSASGIKMTSSVIGLMILVLAIAFLYLYLLHVFPINEFNIDNSGMK